VRQQLSLGYFSREAMRSRIRMRMLPPNMLHEHDWPRIDIGAETRSTATKRGRGRSVHEALEEYLLAAPRRGRHRWIVSNDGSGELADYLVIEVGRDKVFVDLWHAKFAHGSAPGVRVTDMQEVVAQAIKSRRWITEVGLWAELGARLKGRATPQATVIDGNSRLLDVLCGETHKWERLSYARTRPIVTGHVGIVQPGLSRHKLENDLVQPRSSQSALQTRDLLAAFHDSVSMVATVMVLCSR